MDIHEAILKTKIQFIFKTACLSSQSRSIIYILPFVQPLHDTWYKGPNNLDISQVG